MAIFGKTDDGTEDIGAPKEYVYGCMLTMPENGTITKITARIKLAANGNVKFAIYSDDGTDDPDVVLQESSASAVGTAYSWVDFTISYIATGAVKYHFEFIADQGWTIRATTTGVANSKSLQTYPTFPDPFGTPTTEDNKELCIYVTYTPPTPAGGGKKPFYLTLTHALKPSTMKLQRLGLV